MKETIAIIGNGNMGQAIAQGLLGKKISTQDRLFVTNSQTKNNKEVAKKASLIILAVKPQKAAAVLEEIREVVTGKLVMSIMAGITIDVIQQSLGRNVAVVRVMPNLGAKVGKSMSVWVKSKEVTENHETIAKTILEAIGMQLQLQDENQINKATAISGSGPAYFFYLTELLEKEAVALGFTQEEARILASQTLLGSAELLRLSNQSTGELRHAVTSKGGTTEAAIQAFQEAGLQDIVGKGVLSAFKRANELGMTSAPKI